MVPTLAAGAAMDAARRVTRERPRKAVVPAAGLGTRFLPATKVVPKEMLPIVDTPTIELVVAEAARAGLSDVLLVTARGKDAIAEHFDAAPYLEEHLSAKGDGELLAAVRRSASLARVHTVRQAKPLGLGHAVGCARAHVGDAAFAVLLGDDLIDERDRLLERMLDLYVATGGAVLALMEVPDDRVGLYGIAAVSPAGQLGSDVVWVRDLLEKPAPTEAPSNLAVLGRYVLPPEVFDALADLAPGVGGEIQLTDALRVLATRADPPVHGIVFSGRRYDTGDRAEYLRTVVRLASEHPELGPDFRSWLRKFVGTLAATPAGNAGGVRP